MAYQMVDFPSAESLQRQRPDLQQTIFDSLNRYVNAQEARYKPEAARLGIEQTQQNMSLHPLRQRLLEAQIAKANQPAQLSGELGQLLTLRERYPAGSQERNWVESVIKNKAAGSAGTQFSIDPKTGVVNFSQGGTRNAAGMMVTPEGEVIQKPTTATVTATQKQLSSNVARELAAQELKMPYMGFGSSASMAKDLYNYTQNPNSEEGKAAGKRLVDAAVSEKMVPEIAGFQIASQGLNPSKYSINFQKHAIMQGWPEALKHIVNNLPPELQKQAKEEHDKQLKAFNKVRAEYFAKGFPIELEGTKKAETSVYAGQPAWVTDSNKFKQWYATLAPEEKQKVKDFYKK